MLPVVVKVEKRMTKTRDGHIVPHSEYGVILHRKQGRGWVGNDDTSTDIIGDIITQYIETTKTKIIRQIVSTQK